MCAGGRVPTGPAVHSALAVVVTGEGRSCVPLPTVLQTLSISPHPRHLSVSRPHPALSHCAAQCPVGCNRFSNYSFSVAHGSEEVGSELEDALSWGVAHVVLMTRLELWVLGGSPQRECVLPMLSYQGCPPHHGSWG